MFINSPDKFAAWFNETYPGTYRSITAEDARDLTACGLICRYRSYSKSQDGETIRGILRYEQMRERRSAQETSEYTQEPTKCKMCSKPLPPESEGKRGRRRQYCADCESSRNTERYQRWRKRKRRQWLAVP